jgi:hypothetical protein
LDSVIRIKHQPSKIAPNQIQKEGKRIRLLKRVKVPQFHHRCIDVVVPTWSAKASIVTSEFSGLPNGGTGQVRDSHPRQWSFLASNKSILVSTPDSERMERNLISFSSPDAH